MQYAGSVDENVCDVEVMRIKAVDVDLRPTDNWLAKFVIIKGNEDKLFSIATDKETNEGILTLIKVWKHYIQLRVTQTFSKEERKTKR